MSVAVFAEGCEAAAAPAAVRADFPAFYTEVYPDVARYCWMLVRDRELAHDLAQEAFTRLLARWVGVREPRLYLFHIATNLARASWKRAARDRAAMNGLEHEARRPAPGTDEAAVIALRSAVDRLPERYRAIVLLHYYADLTVPAVAAAVGRPPGTVKRMLSEARALLADGMGGRDA